MHPQQYNSIKTFYCMNRIQFMCSMQKEDALEGLIENCDNPYNCFYEEPDVQHEHEDGKEVDAPNEWQYISQ